MVGMPRNEGLYGKYYGVALDNVISAWSGVPGGFISIGLTTGGRCKPNHLTPVLV